MGTNWQTHCLCNAAHGKRLRVLPADADEEVEIGPAGGTALTAWCGFVQDGKPQAGDVVLVSGAAGGTGVHVGQIAKIMGCFVVGTAGSDEKCAWLRDEIGFDATLNYKRLGGVPALTKALREEIKRIKPGTRSADI